MSGQLTNNASVDVPLLSLDAVEFRDQSQLSSLRWIMVVIYVLAGAANAMVLMTWSPIFNQGVAYFLEALGSNSVSTGVNVMFSAFQIMYLPGTLVAVYLQKQYGLRYTMIYGGILTALGCLIRWIAAQVHSSNGPDAQVVATYVFILIGTFIVAQVQPVYLNLPTLISMTWFSVGERDFAMTILSLANTAGAALGSIVPTLIVKERDTAPTALGPDISMLLLVQLIVAIIALALVYYGYANAPAVPPSIGAERLLKQQAPPALSGTEPNSNRTKAKGTKEVSMYNSVCKLLKSTQYLLLLCAFGCALGIVNSLASLLGQLPTNNTPYQVGVIGFCLILCGFFGAVISGILLSKFKMYATTLKIAYIAALISWICFFLSCHNDNFTVMCLTAGLTGFFIFATIPAGIQCAVECTHPISEDLVVGMLYFLSNVVTIPCTFIGQAVLNVNTSADDTINAESNYGISFGWFAVFSTSVLGVGFLCVLAFRSGDYRRLKLDVVADIDANGQETPRQSFADPYKLNSPLNGSGRNPYRGQNNGTIKGPEALVV